MFLAIKRKWQDYERISHQCFETKGTKNPRSENERFSVYVFGSDPLWPSANRKSGDRPVLLCPPRYGDMDPVCFDVFDDKIALSISRLIQISKVSLS